jgi:NurA domain
MLHNELLNSELRAKREDFSDFAEVQASDIAELLKGLKNLEAADARLVSDRLADTENPGSVPSEELFTESGFVRCFSEEWKNHENARDWATRILAKRTTFAADGSQVYLEKETSLPVGAVQIGWFENPHDSEKNYEKNSSFELLTPKRLLENQEEPLNPETRVGEIRFQAEAERVADFLKKKKGWKDRGERMPLAFYDGTLLAAFPQRQTALQMRNLEKMVELVIHSKKCRVPLVGYVDRGFSKDLVTMIGSIEPVPIEIRSNVYDTTLLSAATSNFTRVLDHWGARTVFCFSKRKGLKVFEDKETGRSEVGFAYLQTTSDSGPARLDIPSWVYFDGLIDEVVDVVRAECVVGLGYPYVLETADAAAVLSNSDRSLFIRKLQDFAKTEQLDFSVSRKMASKQRRR